MNILMKIIDSMFFLDKPLCWLYTKTALLEPKKIIRRIYLKDYAPVFGNQYFEVWVNPSVDLRKKLRFHIINLAAAGIPIIHPDRINSAEEITELSAKAKQLYEEQLQIFAVILSQGSKRTRLSALELRALIDRFTPTDPAFFSWLFNSISRVMEEHLVRFQNRKE